MKKCSILHMRVFVMRISAYSDTEAELRLKIEVAGVKLV